MLFMYFTKDFSRELQEAGVIVILILKMRKLRLKEVKLSMVANRLSESAGGRVQCSQGRCPWPLPSAASLCNRLLRSQVCTSTSMGLGTWEALREFVSHLLVFMMHVVVYLLVCETR